MIILSHRGNWATFEQQNTLESLYNALKSGYGIETDIRDCAGKLVISHDMPDMHAPVLSEFLEFAGNFEAQDQPLALNIKSDGLMEDLQNMLSSYGISNYFVFDMSFPDMRSYIRGGLNVFSRQSDFEPTPYQYGDSKGVWLDEFEHHWFTEEAIADHLAEGKDVCVVSPELHSRTYHSEWEQYRNIDRNSSDRNGRLMICTDHPIEARNYFN